MPLQPETDETGGGTMVKVLLELMVRVFCPDSGTGVHVVPVYEVSVSFHLPVSVPVPFSFLQPAKSIKDAIRTSRGFMQWFLG